MPLKSVRKADAEWNGHNSEDQKCLRCVVARLGDHVIDIECAKQDMISSSALQSEFYGLSTDGAHDIRTENVCVPSKDKEADLGTKYLDGDRIKRCVTKMEMMFTTASAGKQLPVVSGTGVIIEEDLIEGQSWTIGVVLLVTAGVVLLSCACFVHYSHLPTVRTVTRKPEVARQPSCMTPRSMRAEIIDHVKERQDSLVQFLRRIATMSEDQVKCIYNSRVCGEFFDWVTSCDDYLYESKLWSHDRIHTQALSEERTGEDGDVKSCSRIGLPICDYELCARD